MISTKNILRPIILLTLFLTILAAQLSAQDRTEINTTCLSWTGDEYTLYYVVEFQKDDEAAYQEITREQTGELSIELSLQPGRYHFRVIPYDFFEKPGPGSEWMIFEVLPSGLSSGGVDSEQGTARERPKLFDIYLSAAWIPLAPIYGEENSFFAGNFSPAGAGARLGAFYSNLSYFNPGLELTASWYSFKSDDVSHNIITAGLNLLAQKRINKAGINFRLGAGVSFTEGERTFHTNLGLSFLWFPITRFFIEAGLDYSHLITENFYGSLRPFTGVGVRF